MKKIVLLSLLILPAVLLASSGHGGEESRYFLQTGRESDFWPRLVNFTIFASLLYYLLANPVKNFFKGRSEDISSQLKEIEEKLKAAKDIEKDAQTNLENSVNRAEIILADAQKEANILTKKIADANENELVTMQKQFDEKITLEEKKAVRATIDEILNENISNDDILVDETKVVEIIDKKVA